MQGERSTVTVMMAWLSKRSILVFLIFFILGWRCNQ